MKKMVFQVDEMIFVAAVFAVTFGLIGLGCGLIWLSFTQSIGTAILSFVGGGLLGTTLYCFCARGTEKNP